MSTAVQTGGRPLRRAPVGRIVLVVVLIAIVMEPIVMYRSLLRQREARQLQEQSELMASAPSLSTDTEAGR